MRQFIYLIVIAAAAYLGYTFYTERMGAPATEEVSTPPAKTASGATTVSPDAEPAVAVFRSKIAIPVDARPGEKHLAPPGTYYMLERSSIQHATGVAAVIPGEPVKLMSRKADGTMKVASGKYEFEVKESQLTNDLDVAQSAERKDFAAHPVKR